jgi:hypothetical protein
MIRRPIVAASAVAFVVVGCVVSSFEKVDMLSDASGPECLDPCTDGSNGETGCCFDQPEGNDDECGYEVAEYGGVCLPFGGPGVSEPSCPASSQGLAGCCMENGLCGYEDPEHDLGCMPAEAFGNAPEPCSESPCGAYCLAAQNAGCDLVRDAEFPLWDCTERCIDGPCVSELDVVVQACTPSGECLANGDPAYAVPDWDGPCRAALLSLASCFEVQDGFGPECTQYCALMMSACIDPSELQYGSVENCLSICGDLFDADALEHGSLQAGTTALNTLACRFVAIGDPSLGGTRAEACAGAGPAGDFGSGGSRCGTGICESYCTLMSAVCPNEFEHATLGECIAACSDGETFAYNGNPGGDTTACRLNHLTFAITETSDPTIHCENARSDSPACAATN